MASDRNQLIIGSAIVLLGLFALLMNLNIAYPVQNIFGGITLLLLAGLATKYYIDYRKGSTLALAIILAVLGLFILLYDLIPRLSELFVVVLFYALAVIFALMYMRKPHQWWAVLPAGGLFTMATVNLLNIFRLVPNRYLGALFFMGWALTFAYLWLEGREAKKHTWAIYPALILVLLGLWMIVNMRFWFRSEWLFPIVLIILGVLFILKAGKVKNQ
ncbi:hypothetical protein GF406_25535 [candidate division KSB1 bacterium]|nr:hypothetical protein [candidate division KSB1 bacterium]